MFRWIFVSLLLSACGVAAVWILVPHLTSAPLSPTDTHPTASRPKRAAAADREPEAAPPRPVAVVMANRRGGQAEVTIYHRDNAKAQELTEPILIPGGTLIITEKQVVPAAKDGVIIAIATPVSEDTAVPPEKRLPKVRLGILAVPVAAGEQPQDGERFFTIPGDPTSYRRVRDSEVVEPNKAKLFQELLTVSKLEVGDRVQRGQLLALIDPQKQLDEVRSKIYKINATEVERAAAEVQETEYKRRYDTQQQTNRGNPGAIPKDSMMEIWIQYKKHQSEKEVKKAETLIAQAALNAALTDLKLHEVRAAIDGRIKFIHKNHQGDAIKQHEPIMEIWNSARMRVDARLEYQEALKLKEGMTAIVEPSRPDSPLVISGHLGPVNCVAVSKGKRPVIISGSDDETLRAWDSVTGVALWKVSGQRSAVRSVACTSPASPHNLACFGCADGSVRVMDLDKPEPNPRELSERHRGPVLGIAFSPKGETIATCGDYGLIHLWNTETGSLLHTLSGHSGTVTSVQFASANRLVSAGKDNRLIVWDVEPGKPPHAIAPRFDWRGGEVSTLGVSPDGKTVLFDQGKELRLLTLDGQRLVGTLQNPTLGMNFSTMALFSPDGKTILTNGPAPGRLQLWRTPVTQMHGSELRSFVWSTPNGIATCGAFAPEVGEGSFAVTGTQDHKVLVWSMPSQQEIESRLEARLTLVEYNLDTQSRHVKVWAELDNPGWLIPGMQATMVVLPPRK